MSNFPAAPNVLDLFDYENDRLIFEMFFPVPKGVQFNSKGGNYVFDRETELLCDHDLALKASEWQWRWEGWQTRASVAALPVKPRLSGRCITSGEIMHFAINYEKRRQFLLEYIAVCDADSKDEERRFSVHWAGSSWEKYTLPQSKERNDNHPYLVFMSEKCADRLVMQMNAGEVIIPLMT